MHPRAPFFPPNLPPAPETLMPETHLLARFPCTRYWHWERQTRVAGLPPPGVPHWLARFDWLVGWSHGWGDAKRIPDSVFCHPDCADILLAALRKHYAPADFADGLVRRILVFGGEDTHLSSIDQNIFRDLREYFKYIYFEAKDIESDDVYIMPIGLQEFYIRGIDGSINEIYEKDYAKSDLVLSSFGFFWPQLNNIIQDRHDAIEFTKNNKYITAGPFDRVEYFEKLASHKFMLCPLGNGVQAPKIVEALMMACIPIMTPSVAAVELRAKGAPILIVDHWRTITPDLLADAYARLQKPAAEFRKNTQIEKWWDFSFKPKT